MVEKAFVWRGGLFCLAAHPDFLGGNFLAITQHKIDGTNINFVNSAHWLQPVIDQSLDLIAVHQKVRRHTWTAGVMTAAEWSTVLAKRGSVVSITTTDVNDRNADYITYYGVKVQSVTFRRHEGPNMRGVEMEFLVRV
jgi:hypothetical protein